MTQSTDLTARARIRLAALELFARQGFEPTTTRAIAAEAGVSHALVRHHYGSKEGLRQAVDEDLLDSFDTAVSSLATPASGDELMAVLGTASAQLFGADSIRRDYLRRLLLEGSDLSSGVFSRLLSGARDQLAALRSAGAITGGDERWAPYQVLFLILGPLLLEPLLQSTLGEPPFAPQVLAGRSAANQQLLLHGLSGANGMIER
ncbi:TetR/AcrR family transcriptional regulator [Kribbella sp. NPDC056861]|uniref:TetR/AcrR family transcriptional regulator n=1 Tax=Kribbella sp. NPDC056861 TaxID=3154857 RepID=UPI00342FC7BA